MISMAWKLGNGLKLGLSSMKGPVSEKIIMLDKRKIQDIARWLESRERMVETRDRTLSQG